MYTKLSIFVASYTLVELVNNYHFGNARSSTKCNKLFWNADTRCEW